jgi:NAD(P)H-dependent FMN reductase
MFAAMTKLRTVVFMGSARNRPARWGGPARLGTRVLRYVVRTLAARPEPGHEVEVLDPLELRLPMLEAPYFYYADGTAPPELEAANAKVRAADCYVIVTPEYNHSIPPALANLLDHFGGSAYACKPSGFVTYSNGQWGGIRAAMQLRALTAELGCLSVSRTCGIPNAGKEFDEDGNPEDPARWEKMLGGMLNQLEWMAMAMKNHRAAAGMPK